MARPKLKGSTIGVQLPLELDAEVRSRAEGEGLAVGAYLSNLVSRAFVGAELAASLPSQVASNTRTPRAAAALQAREVGIVSSAPNRELTPEPVCAHRDRVQLGGGMVRCKTCGAMRDVHGAWKVVH